ncbi:MAG: CPBP family intramembrane metalloprotease [Pseudonocardiaceae bacterium]|nr:CPBP family intramembrane metalloprotease [Pseudonocardiaceae bacterium]
MTGSSPPPEYRGRVSVIKRAAAEPAASRRRAVYLAAEYAVLFFGAVIGYYFLARGTTPIPVLVVLGVAAVAYLLRQSGFDRTSLWRPSALRGQWRSVLLLWGLTAGLAAGVLAIARPELLLGLPRENLAVWALVMVFYPLLSVYPQELIFRAFLFHRYAPVFGGGAAMVGASATAFGFVHIAFGNWVSVVLSFAGGWIFATRYRRTRSLFAASVEHALYGMLMFTIGLGLFFYHGAAQG